MSQRLQFAGQRVSPLRDVAGAEAHDEVTWLRLAALAESPEEQVALIKQVLRINPANEKARATLVDAEKQLAQTHLKQASAEIEAGQYANARAALRRSLQLVRRRRRIPHLSPYRHG